MEHQRFVERLKPGALLLEFDLHSHRTLSRYIILDINWPEETMAAYCLADTTRYFSQGDIITLHFDEIQSNDRYVWTLQ